MEDINSSTNFLSNIIAFCICTSPLLFILGGAGLFVYTRRNKNQATYTLPAEKVAPPAGPAVAAADPEATMLSKVPPVAKVEASARFAPSELTLLNGDKFAKKVGVVTGKEGSVDLLHLEQRVAAGELGQAALAAAVLANEQQGAFRLEIRQTKAMFGLTTANTLFVEPTGGRPSWPAGSLEAQLYILAAEAQPGKNDVANLVYRLLRKDSGMPWTELADMIKAGLAERGLLEVIEEKKLKLFTVRRYVLPETTLTLSQQQAPEPVQALLAQCQNQRPEIWQALIKGCSQAISRRTERDRDSDGPDMDFD